MLKSEGILRILENNRVIVTNALSLIGTLVVTSGLGFVFWWLVAREFDLQEAGLASAAVSAMFLLSTIGMLGMGTLLIGELARRPEMKLSLILTALVISGGSSAILGIGFGVAASRLSENFALLLTSWWDILLFATGASITCMVLVVDQALLGLLHGNWQFWRNSVFSTAKLFLLLPVVYVLGSKSGMSIYLAWLVGNLLSVLVLVFFVGIQRLWSSDYRLQWMVFWELRSIAGAHHLLNLSLQAAQFAMPVIVTLILTPEANAGFYIGWLIASSLFIIPTSLTQTLFAISAADVSVLAQKIRFTLRMSLLGVFAAGTLLFVLSRHILLFFNPSYENVTILSLQVLVLAAVPITIRAHYVAIHQIRRQINRAAIRLMVFALIELMFAIAGAVLGGLVGLSAGWVLAICVEGILMSPVVFHTAMAVRTSPLSENGNITEG